MNNITNISAYGMFSVNKDYFYSAYMTDKDVHELKRIKIALTKSVQAVAIMYVQRYDYGKMLINKRAMCAVSWHYVSGSISSNTYYCGSLQAAEKTFRAMQKALEKQCIK